MPALEVKALIHDIDRELGTCLAFPRPAREPGFLLNFDEQGSPRPRYLGRVNVDISVDEMESKIPGPEYKAPGETEEPEDRSFEAFKAKIEAAIQAGKNKTKYQKQTKKRQRIGQKESWCAQLKRVQCYLGIRPRQSAVPLDDPVSVSSDSWDAFLEAQKASDLARCINLPELDVTKSVPYPFSQGVVFVCVDIEAWEKDHSTITEIGVATLDTNDLMDLPPGEDGKAWMTAIRPRHFRISEFQHLVNSDFVSGCADRFEKDFGTSEFISAKDAPQVIASCFKTPYSASFQMRSHRGTPDGGVNPSVAPGDSSRRNIVLVGHDTKTDINYMRNLGYDVSNLSNVLEAVDTAAMFKALKHEEQSGSLGRILLELGMVGWNLHNAVSALLKYIKQPRRLRSSRLPNLSPPNHQSPLMHAQQTPLNPTYTNSNPGQRRGLHAPSHDRHLLCRSSRPSRPQISRRRRARHEDAKRRSRSARPHQRRRRRVGDCRYRRGRWGRAGCDPEAASYSADRVWAV